MGITSLTSCEFNQDAARAKKAALTGPVFITDRGWPVHVLLSIDEYHWLTGTGETLRHRVALVGLRCSLRSAEVGRPVAPGRLRLPAR